MIDDSKLAGTNFCVVIMTSQWVARVTRVSCINAGSFLAGSVLTFRFERGKQEENGNHESTSVCLRTNEWHGPRYVAFTSW